MIQAVALSGPTASGKTSLSLSLAEKFGMEIISCDSMQIYRHMDIGTAKAAKEERARVPHHLIDILEPSECYSAEDYAKDALACAKQIEKRGSRPLFVGGTGLYLDAVLRGGEWQTPPTSPAYHEKYEEQTKTEEGRLALYERLLTVDPVSAAATHPNNVRRVLRALEIYDLTGISKSEWDKKSKEQKGPFDVAHLTLDAHDRDFLYKRADLRIDEMMKAGLLEEVKNLYGKGFLTPQSTAAQAIGYKELRGVLDGKISLDEAVEQLKLSTRHYIKRQLTWFHATDAVRIYIDTEDGCERSFSSILSDAEDAVLRKFPD